MIKQQKEFAVQHFISPVLLSSLIHYAEKNQIDFRPWFNDLNLNIQQIRQGDGFLPFQIICTVIQRAVDQHPHIPLGLLIGRDESLVSMGILGFAMQACQNVGGALELGLKYHPISGSALHLTASLVLNQLELKILQYH